MIHFKCKRSAHFWFLWGENQGGVVVAGIYIVSLSVIAPSRASHHQLTIYSNGSTTDYQRQIYIYIIQIQYSLQDMSLALVKQSFLVWDIFIKLLNKCDICCCKSFANTIKFLKKYDFVCVVFYFHNIIAFIRISNSNNHIFCVKIIGCQ